MYKKSLKWEISESATFKLYLIEHCQQGDLLCLTRTCKQFELFIKYFTFSVFENINPVSLRNKVRLLQQLKNVKLNKYKWDRCPILLCFASKRSATCKMRTTEKTAKCVKMGSTFLPLARLLFMGQTNHFRMIKNNSPFDRIPFWPLDTYTPSAVIFRNKVKFDEPTEERMLYFLNVWIVNKNC